MMPRRGGGGRRGHVGGGRTGGNRRPPRTQEDLDRELDDYLNSSETGGGGVVGNGAGAGPAGEEMVLD